jgi:hypothetical protein
MTYDTGLSLPPTASEGTLVGVRDFVCNPVAGGSGETPGRVYRAAKTHDYTVSLLTALDLVRAAEEAPSSDSP